MRRWSVPIEALRYQNSKSKALPSGTPTGAGREKAVLEARKWVAAQPASHQGKGGDKQTWKIAFGLVVGFGLTKNEARQILNEYNLRCDPNWTSKELEHKLECAEKKARENPARVGYRLRRAARDKCSHYKLKNGCIVRVTGSPDDPQHTPLVNFEARIVKQVTKDDGSELQTCLCIEGKRKDGTPLPPVTIRIEEFLSNDWVLKHWGVDAIVYAHAANHLRVALQELSKGVERQVIFTHIGWVRIEGEWFYLHGLGAIGAHGLRADVTVELPATLSHFKFEEVPSKTALRRVIQSVLDSLLDVAPDETVFALIAAVFRAPLSECDFSVYFHGKTGGYKTSMAVLGQKFFGREFSRSDPPASFDSTANANEVLAFTAKDALLLLDDFVSSGTRQDDARLQKSADRTFRAQGNGSGRARLRQDGSLRPVKKPRGLILATGEDVPSGQSLAARLVLCEFRKGDVDFQRLLAAHHCADKGDFELCMAGFLRYVAKNRASLLARRKKEVAKLHQDVSANGQHSRTPENIAQLGWGLKVFLRFARKVGAITQERHDELWQRGWKALRAVALQQGEFQKVSDPALNFLSLIRASITSGRAHLQNKNGNAPDNATGYGWRMQDGKCTPQGTAIGWCGKGVVYLEPQAAYATAQKLASEQNSSLSVSTTTLNKRLNEGGHLASTSKKRGTLIVRKMLGGREQKVLVVKESSLFGKKPAKPAISKLKGKNGSFGRFPAVRRAHKRKRRDPV